MVVLTPPLGWNTWNTYGCDINEKMVLESARVMISSGLRDAGYEYVVLDDGWQLRQRDANGSLVADPAKFPRGIRALADDLHAMGLAPCAYSMTFNVTGNKLNAILNQRSQDMLTANNWNVVQYAVLTHMMAQASGLEVGELVHVIADCHIYDRHIPAVKAMLEKDGFEAPVFKMDRSIDDFYKFTTDDFKLEDYKFNEFNIKIPVAV